MRFDARCLVCFIKVGIVDVNLQGFTQAVSMMVLHVMVGMHVLMMKVFVHVEMVHAIGGNVVSSSLWESSLWLSSLSESPKW